MPGFDNTNHNLSDFKVDNNSSTTTYYGKADHFIGDKVWTVEGTYETVLVRVNNNWLITKQKFNFIRQFGDTELPAVATERLKAKI